MEDLKSFAAQLVNLSVKEVQELSSILKDEYGIEASSVAVAPAAAAVEAPVAGAEEAKTAFDVVLTSAGGTKLAVVKLVKEMTGLGLKEAKDLVDAAPKAVKEGLDKTEAESMQKRLEEAGASVELK